MVPPPQARDTLNTSAEEPRTTLELYILNYAPFRTFPYSAHTSPANKV